MKPRIGDIYLHMVCYGSGDERAEEWTLESVTRRGYAVMAPAYIGGDGDTVHLKRRHRVPLATLGRWLDSDKRIQEGDGPEVGT